MVHSDKNLNVSHNREPTGTGCGLVHLSNLDLMPSHEMIQDMIQQSMWNKTIALISFLTVVTMIKTL